MSLPRPFVVLVVAFCALVVWVRARELARTVDAAPVMRSADAVPLYLSAVASATGRDPTRAADLEAVYRERRVGVPVALFSTLYPSTAGALLRPAAELSWPAFAYGFRRVLWVGGLLGAALTGAAALPRRRLLGAAIGLLLASFASPHLLGCAILGQINLLLAGLMGAVLYLASRGRLGPAVGLSVLGAALKLVPGLLVLPLLVAAPRRVWAWGLSVGLVLLAWGALHLPLAKMVAGVMATLRFQSGVIPDWMGMHPTFDWMISLGVFRHRPLLVLTVLVIALELPFGPPGAKAHPGDKVGLLGVMAMCTAYLGADAAGFHVFYSPLYLPAMVWCGVRALAPTALRELPISLLLLACALSPLLLDNIAITLPIEARAVLGGLLVWAGCFLTLRPWKHWGAARGLLLLSGFAWAIAHSLLHHPPRTF